MFTVPTVWLKNLSDFFEFLEWESCSGRYHATYRGEPWGNKTPLHPTADRNRRWRQATLRLNGKGIPKDISSYVQLKKTHRDFMRQAALHRESWYPAEGDYLGTIALMAHYGAATPLLDVTRSFLIAAHFAAHSPQTGRGKPYKDGCVWRISSEISRKMPDYPCLEVSGMEEQQKNEIDALIETIQNSLETDIDRASKLLENAHAEKLQDDGVNHSFEFSLDEDALRYGLGAFLYTPKNPSPRLAAQDGLFLVGLNPTYPLPYHLKLGGTGVAPFLPENGTEPCKIWPENKDSIDNFAQFKESDELGRTNIWRIGLSAALCSALDNSIRMPVGDRSILEKLNIRESMLFPDLAGRARATDIAATLSG